VRRPRLADLARRIGGYVKFHSETHAPTEIFERQRQSGSLRPIRKKSVGDSRTLIGEEQVIALRLLGSSGSYPNSFETAAHQTTLTVDSRARCASKRFVFTSKGGLPGGTNRTTTTRSRRQILERGFSYQLDENRDGQIPSARSAIPTSGHAQLSAKTTDSVRRTTVLAQLYYFGQQNEPFPRSVGRAARHGGTITWRSSRPATRHAGRGAWSWKSGDRASYQRRLTSHGVSDRRDGIPSGPAVPTRPSKQAFWMPQAYDLAPTLGAQAWNEKMGSARITTRPTSHLLFRSGQRLQSGVTLKNRCSHGHKQIKDGAILLAVAAVTSFEDKITYSAKLKRRVVESRLITSLNSYTVWSYRLARARPIMTSVVTSS